LAKTIAEEQDRFSQQDSIIEKRVAKVAKIVLYIGMCNVIVIMFLTVSHAISRYIFNQPLFSLVSISSLLLAIMIFAVGAYTQVVKGHIIVGVIVDRLSERKRAIIDSFTYIICLVVLALAFWQSVLQGIFMVRAGTTSGILHLPQFIFFFIIALGWGVFSLVIVLQLRHMLFTAFRRTMS